MEVRTKLGWNLVINWSWAKYGHKLDIYWAKYGFGQKLVKTWDTHIREEHPFCHPPLTTWTCLIVELGTSKTPEYAKTIASRYHKILYWHQNPLEYVPTWGRLLNATNGRSKMELTRSSTEETALTPFYSYH